jgi:hypothetical protein
LQPVASQAEWSVVESWFERLVGVGDTEAEAGLADVARARLATAFEGERLRTEGEALELWSRLVGLADSYSLDPVARHIAFRDLESRADRAVLLVAAMCGARSDDGVAFEA